MQSRLFYMDILRGVLMMLGVVLHGFRIYDGSGTWLVHDVAASSVAKTAVAVIHTFRMPAFFIIAGFFSALLLTRRSSGEFLRQRLLRIGLPLLTTALTLNVIQAYLVSPSDPFGVWRAGMWLSHLWFLEYLLVYTFVAIGLFAFIPGLLKKVASYAFTGPGFLILLAALPILTVVIQIVAARLTRASGVPTDLARLLEDITFFCVFYLFGILWKLSPARTLPVSHWTLLALTALGAAVLVFHTALPGPAARVLYRIAPIALNWWSALLCIVFGERWLNHDTRTFRFLSEASYSIYLFHHLFVVGLGMALLSFQIPVLFKAAIVIVLTFIVTIAIHGLVRSITPLSILFNGQTYSRKPDEALVASGKTTD